MRPIDADEKEQRKGDVMKKFFDWWPFMLKSNHEAVRRENFNLRGALGQTNAELRKHRLLLGSLREGNEAANAAVRKAMSRTE